MSIRFLVGDALGQLANEPTGHYHVVVTSPPYVGLRSYLPAGHSLKGAEIGTEASVQEYLGRLVEVFSGVRRVLRRDGSLWVVVGDTFVKPQKRGYYPEGCKVKDLLGLPFLLAFALREAGWYLRGVIPWVKANPLPDNVNDRPGVGTEYVLFLTNGPECFYDKHAVLIPHKMRPQRRPNGHKRRQPGPTMPEHTWSGTARSEPAIDGNPAGRLRRNTDWFWESLRRVQEEGEGLLLDSWGEPMAFQVNPRPYKGGHFAVFPPQLVIPMIQASTSERGVCAHCGAPWVRQLGEPEEAEGRGSGNAERLVAVNGERGRTNDHIGAGVPWRPTVVPTVGWNPSCTCSAGEPVPARVLDPFGGHGTTGLVAYHLGRDAALIDLWDANMEAAEQRIAVEMREEGPPSRQEEAPPLRAAPTNPLARYAIGAAEG